MMDLKVVCLACFLIGFVASAPVHELPKAKQDLIRNFVEFIQDDKEIGPILEKMNEQQLIRNRRQTDDEGASVEGAEAEAAPPSEGGFFDRAAKFVMEVLQRFLKWINSDN